MLRGAVNALCLVWRWGLHIAGLLLVLAVMAAAFHEWTPVPGRISGPAELASAASRLERIIERLQGLIPVRLDPRTAPHRPDGAAPSPTTGPPPLPPDAQTGAAAP